MSDSPHVIHLARALQECGEILTVKEVADALKFEPDTVATWLNAGTLRGFKIGREWRITKAELLEDIAARYNTTTAQPAGPGAAEA